jgi:ABC-type branched-subunit amino acid transport system substrate-binding protein
MRRNWYTAVAVMAVLAVAGCGDSTNARTDPLQRKPGEVHLYGTDGNMLNGIGDLLSKDHPNSIIGMKGTTPLTPVSQSFKDRLLAVDPGLKDMSYAGEAYDAVVVAALAAQIAKNTGSKAIAGQINGVTVGGQDCPTPAECLNLIKAGSDVAYRGITLGLGGFTDAGEPSATTYGILRFAASSHLDDGQTQFVPTGTAGNATKTPPPAPVAAPAPNLEPLRVGALLPHTGDLASAGPPMFAGAQLAVKEINAAGGILNQPVKWVDGDDGTDKEKAVQTTKRLIQDEHVQVIIGAGASSITKAVLPTVLAGGVVLISPCNTAAELSTAPDQGLYFRTAPPDDLQAAALTDIIMRDGVRKVAIISREDAYGSGLRKSVKEDLIRAGLATDAVKEFPYDPDNADFSGVGPAVRDFNPDGVLIIGFDETAEAIDSLLKAGITSISN